MKTFIELVLQWPGIVQGLLASLLFAIISQIGSYVFARARSGLSKTTRARRKELLQIELLHHLALTKAASESLMGASISFLTFASLRHLVRALIMLCLGLIAGTFAPAFGVAGYAMALFYLFRASDYVKLSDNDDDANVDHDAEVRRLKGELDKLQAELDPRDGNK